jgi:hypothetical protein
VLAIDRTVGRRRIASVAAITRALGVIAVVAMMMVTMVMMLVVDGRGPIIARMATVVFMAPGGMASTR